MANDNHIENRVELCLGPKLQPQDGAQQQQQQDNSLDTACISRSSVLCFLHESYYLLIGVIFCFFANAVGGVVSLSPASAVGGGGGGGKAAPQHANNCRQDPYKRRQTPKGKGHAGANKGARRTGKRNANVVVVVPGDSSSGEPPRQLACPCYKFNPITHLECLIRHNIFETSIVVQHLERVHGRQPIHCPICGVIFATRSACNSHIQEQNCAPQLFHHEGLTEDQIAELHVSRRNLSNEEERWNHIWAIVYPTSPCPASPYVGGVIEEILGIVRRAIHAHRKADGTNPVGSVLRDYVANHGISQAQNEAGLDGIVTRVEALSLDYPRFLSAIPRGRDDLSYLTSDFEDSAMPYFSQQNNGLLPVYVDNGGASQQRPHHSLSQQALQLQHFVSFQQEDDPFAGVDDTPGESLLGGESFDDNFPSFADSSQIPSDFVNPSDLASDLGIGYTLAAAPFQPGNSATAAGQRTPDKKHVDRGDGRNQVQPG